MHLIKQITAVIVLCSGIANALADLPAPQCQQEIDAAVVLYNSGNTRASEKALNRLNKHCAQWPQIHHNLGVLAASTEQWQNAVAHFEHAIQAIPQAAQTLNHLRAIYQYQASAAFQTALGQQASASLPELFMQNSSTYTEHAQADQNTQQLYDISTIEYELYDWWHAAAQNQAEAWLSHYAFGYPPLENNDAARVQWQNVERDIAFTENDAVVVLSYLVGSETKYKQLFMHVQNKHWKIYRETQF